MTKIIKEFLDKSNDGGFNRVNQSFGLESNIIKLKFNKLYAHLILQFFDEGLIKIQNITDPNLLNIKFDELRELLKKDDYTNNENILLNSLYRLLDFHSAIRISGYMNSIMSYYWDKNYSSILYIDTDTIYLKKIIDEDFIKSIGIPYKITYIDSIYFLREKSYLYEENLEIKVVNYKLSDVDEHIISEMKSNIRNNKIKILGI